MRYFTLAVLLFSACAVEAQATREKPAENGGEPSSAAVVEVSRTAMRDCYKTLQAKNLVGPARHEFMRQCINERKATFGANSR